MEKKYWEKLINIPVLHFIIYSRIFLSLKEWIFNIKVFSQKKEFMVNIGVRNLLNTWYIDHLSRLKNIQMPFPGRNVYVSLKYDFSNPLNK